MRKEKIQLIPILKELELFLKETAKRNRPISEAADGPESAPQD